MSTLLEEPETDSAVRASAAQQLRTTMAALRLSFTWWGVRKTLSAQQKSQAAEAFGAEGDFLSAGKKLIDTSNPRYKAVTAVRGRAVQLWKALSLPYPEPGIRLIKHGNLALIDVQLTSLKDELREAVVGLEEHFSQLKAAAQRRLGELYNEADYPAALSGLFDMQWDFPSVEPPDYLRRLSPQMYEAEARRVAARFDEAVMLAETAFTEELAKLVERLAERLSGQTDGKPKTFRDSTVSNLTEFFERFRALNVRSNEQLDELVDQAQQVVRGVEPQQLRDSLSLRQQVAGELQNVQNSLDTLLVDRPRRAILRRPR
ncbi:hypothetical protein [Lignipirellula cremea]|uniref:Uncharacterized protein n=1 Tax=Lignipirellula cremea TaxID=2528010 RepID=A0A518DKI5_9BACT|nr:hypothetical protein [Lignipirellula cremea]QDU92339.1 hypothetical protein Pla8534_00840 [Lignipirellula cremea]